MIEVEIKDMVRVRERQGYAAQIFTARDSHGTWYVVRYDACHETLDTLGEYRQLHLARKRARRVWQNTAKWHPCDGLPAASDPHPELVIPEAELTNPEKLHPAFKTPYYETFSRTTWLHGTKIRIPEPRSISDSVMLSDSVPRPYRYGPFFGRPYGAG